VAQPPSQMSDHAYSNRARPARQAAVPESGAREQRNTGLYAVNGICNLRKFAVIKRLGPSYQREGVRSAEANFAAAFHLITGSVPPHLRSDFSTDTAVSVVHPSGARKLLAFLFCFRRETSICKVRSSNRDNSITGSPAPKSANGSSPKIFSRTISNRLASGADKGWPLLQSRCAPHLQHSSPGRYQVSCRPHAPQEVTAKWQ
jgi:hypothetical protein